MDIFLNLLFHCLFLFRNAGCVWALVSLAWRLGFLVQCTITFFIHVKAHEHQFDDEQDCIIAILSIGVIIILVIIRICYCIPMKILLK